MEIGLGSHRHRDCIESHEGIGITQGIIIDEMTH